ncbi:histidinol dehydrogenase [Olivibacter sitiensis]|uniref:histidinol dehydrogenase n=1 Tax=Olivibacter sitiensis TaxID=376470 RepID=UPI0004104E24|nr:histidinol dehydrogenase [Olivibacter sitiensis]
MLKSYSFNNLLPSEIKELTLRNVDASEEIGHRVNVIIDEVMAKGDAALRDYAQQFDGVVLEQLYIEQDEIDALAATLNRLEQRALEIAFNNIHRFHAAQLRKEKKIETMPGVNCWREPRPIEKVGLYVPGGTAVLPSTFLMLGIPARIAGCKEIVVCSPPQKDGKVNAYLAYVAKLLQIDRIYLAGGAQAIAAMAYGTESIPQVNKVFGPGNQYVTKAKTLLQSRMGLAIDMPAGPSEVLVIADASANARYVAADLLAQAEHGVDSQSILVSTDEDLIAAVNLELRTQLSVLARASFAQKALENSYSVSCDTLADAIHFSNEYAPEHLIIQSDNWEEIVPKVANAGSVFLGHLTPESAGDYASGTNHTLPTSAFARAYSGVSVDSFVKKITFQHIDSKGIQQIGSTVEVLAEIEGLQAHKNAVSIRLQDIKDKK